MQTKSKETLELQTIPEDLELPLTLASPQNRINIEITPANVKSGEKGKDMMNHSSLKDMDMPSFDSSDSSRGLNLEDGNLHSMSRLELLRVQRRTREEKKRYRRAIKEKEEKVLKETGRKRIPKGEKVDESMHALYKLSKAKLKLIEALLSKPGGSAGP